MSKEVFFADVEISIHQADAVNGSKTILPGQYVPLTDLPAYEQEAVRAGKVPGARIMSENDAKLLSEHAAFLRGEVANPDLGEEETPVGTDEVETVSVDTDVDVDDNVFEVEPEEVKESETKTK